jgi:hypothetical protein
MLFGELNSVADALSAPLLSSIEKGSQPGCSGVMAWRSDHETLKIPSLSRPSSRSSYTTDFQHTLLAVSMLITLPGAIHALLSPLIAHD